jgi:hypothetical protein
MNIVARKRVILRTGELTMSEDIRALRSYFVPFKFIDVRRVVQSPEQSFEYVGLGPKSSLDGWYPIDWLTL